MNESKRKYENVCGAFKVVLRRIIMAQKGPNINNIRFHLKKLEKRKANQIPNKQIRVEIHEIENRKQYERIDATKSWFFGKIFLKTQIFNQTKKKEKI